MAKSWFKSVVASTIVLFLAVTGRVEAGPIPYPTPGVVNPVTYTFTAAADGDIVAYFHAGFAAGLVNELRLEVDGVDTGIQGLRNRPPTVYGTSLNFGPVLAGQTLVFVMINLDGQVGPWYSDASRNSDGVNHIYSTDFATDGIIPTGTYVAFEDLPGTEVGVTTDLNYNDLSFVFTNVATQTSVPLPGTLLLVALGLVGAGLARRRAA